MLATVGFGLLVLVMALMVSLIATFVWSSDAGRRGRAREMLVLLLTRAPLMDSGSFASAGDGPRPPWVDEPGRARHGGSPPVCPGDVVDAPGSRIGSANARQGGPPCSEDCPSRPSPVTLIDIA